MAYARPAELCRLPHRLAAVGGTVMMSAQKQLEIRYKLRAKAGEIAWEK